MTKDYFTVKVVPFTTKLIDKLNFHHGKPPLCRLRTCCLFDLYLKAYNHPLSYGRQKLCERLNTLATIASFETYLYTTKVSPQASSANSLRETKTLTAELPLLKLNPYKELRQSSLGCVRSSKMFAHNVVMIIIYKKLCARLGNVL
jgi:hypothetical protein